MPLGLGHVLAGPPNSSVIGAHDNGLEMMLLDRLLEDGVKQSSGFPRRAREDFVVGRPIFLRVAMETDGPGDRAFAHPTENAKGQGNGSLLGALLWEDKSPADRFFLEIT